jgi:hypothetical protein
LRAGGDFFGFFAKRSHRDVFEDGVWVHEASGIEYSDEWGIGWHARRK